jgi:uncharacterized membrane protein YbhN (UPF0104 family)
MLSPISRKVLSIFAILTLITFGVGLFIVNHFTANRQLAFALGLALGAGVSAAKWLMAEKALTRAVEMNGKGAEAFAKAQFSLRYLLLGGVLVAAALIDGINLYAAIIGIILFTPAVYLAKIIFKDSLTNGR